MADSNYFLFFKLYRGAPAMGAYLMDYCVDRLRKVALTIMTKVPASLSVEPFSPVICGLAMDVVLTKLRVSVYDRSGISSGRPRVCRFRAVRF